MKQIEALNEQIRSKAIEKGLCDKWKEDWESDWSLDKLVDKFYRGIDFFLDKRFVSNDYIKESFDKDWLRKNGILVDDEYSLLNPDSAIFLGNSQSTIRFNGYNAATIYVTDESNVKVIAKNKSFVLVHVLGNAQVEAKTYDSANITVLIHSKESIVIADNGIKVKEELDYLK